MGPDLLTISEEEYNRWLPPRAALRRLSSITRPIAINAIVTRLAAGTLRIAAGTVSQGTNSDHFVVLNGQRLNKQFLDDFFWATGDATIPPDRLVQAEYRHARVAASGHTVHMVGARFDPAGIADIERQAGLADPTPSVIAGNIRRIDHFPYLRLQAESPPAPPPAPDLEWKDAEVIPLPEPRKHAGGRPRADYWEDLLIEMARQLFEGDLKPQRQVDIENAMHEWLASKGIESSERSVRDRARKLFRAIDSEGKN